MLMTRDNTGRNGRSRGIKDRAHHHAKNLTRVLCVICAAFVLLSVGALAADDDLGGEIASAVNTGANQIYNIFKAIVGPIASIVAVWTAFQIFFGNEQDTQKAKKRAIVIVVVVAVVYLGPAIVKQVSGWFSTSAPSDLTSYF